MSRPERGDADVIVMCILAALVLAALVLAVFGIRADIKEMHAWETFKAAHACKAVAYEEGTTNAGMSIGMNGKPGVVVLSTPSKTAWACDDGVTYWRNN